jgi:hypothetical protein
MSISSARGIFLSLRPTKRIFEIARTTEESMSKSRVIRGVFLSGIFAGVLYAGPAVLPAFGAGASKSSPVPTSE